jgi:translation initiation factor IF-2
MQAEGQRARLAPEAAAADSLPAVLAEEFEFAAALRAVRPGSAAAAAKPAQVRRPALAPGGAPREAEPRVEGPGRAVAAARRAAAASTSDRADRAALLRACGLAEVAFALLPAALGASVQVERPAPAAPHAAAAEPAPAAPHAGAAGAERPAPAAAVAEAVGAPPAGGAVGVEELAARPADAVAAAAQLAVLAVVAAEVSCWARVYARLCFRERPEPAQRHPAAQIPEASRKSSRRRQQATAISRPSDKLLPHSARELTA